MPDGAAASLCELALLEKGGGITELTDEPADDTDGWSGVAVKLVDGPDEKALVLAPKDDEEDPDWEEDPEWEEVAMSIFVAFSISTDESFSCDLHWKAFTIITSSSS